ncbi:hypothetical protein J2W21_003013 [Sinomonas atrocyanea]|uniref:hypothetical protein n=1 Tax=Sinomonas atrocyanea TaxID=37927 RepID=UPI00278BA1F9|nr:hypothetical protein [Sinomonas atrocyanea]MDP9885490.1 hypothetical protein [Sinomonas atrocyanea]
MSEEEFSDEDGPHVKAVHAWNRPERHGQSSFESEDSPSVMLRFKPRHYDLSQYTLVYQNLQALVVLIFADARMVNSMRWSRYRSARTGQFTNRYPSQRGSAARRLTRAKVLSGIRVEKVSLNSPMDLVLSVDPHIISFGTGLVLARLGLISKMIDIWTSIQNARVQKADADEHVARQKLKRNVWELLSKELDGFDGDYESLPENDPLSLMVDKAARTVMLLEGASPIGSTKLKEGDKHKKK